MSELPLGRDKAKPHGRYLLHLCIAALGVVYGDIGTSPLYALRECFHGPHAVPLTEGNVLGVLSLVFWALTIVISLKYLIYVMRADNRGEGGVLALMALATSKTTRGLRRGVLIALGLFGAALLLGDGIITPAISVLSAVEGLDVAAPSLGRFVVPITVVILVLLFLFQRRGTAGVGAVFGPITFVWFLVLAVMGLAHIASSPAILAALSPTYAASFLIHNSLHGFVVLGAVFLVVTGGEALYADMGHFGTRPIRLVWFALVMPSLVLNYFGQGALLIANPATASNPFFRMAPTWALYPLLALSTCATVIASQAVISGVFSLMRQATMLGFWPRVRILHTSAKEIGQIYVPSMNWALMVCTIALVLGFGSSSRLAAAYGIAVTTTMVITTVLAFVVARERWGWRLPAAVALSVVFLIVDLAFFGSNLVKVVDGGWVPLAVAALAMLLMTTWKKGRALLSKRIQERIVPLDDFFELMRVEPTRRVPGAAVFLTSNPEGAPPALLHNFMHNHAVHDQVLLLTVVTEETARVDDSGRVQVQQLPEGFTRVVAHYGFMETPDVLAILARDDTPTPPLGWTTFFLGLETLLAEHGGGMAAWRVSLYAYMARNAFRATAFFNVPPERVMEVGAQIEI